MTELAPGPLSAAPLAQQASPDPAGVPLSAAGRLIRDPRFLLGAVTIAVFTLMAVAPTWFTPYDHEQCDLTNSLVRPSWDHWFGFDLQGCDYYSKAVHGARASMVVGPLVAVTTAIIGVVLGSASGYFGGAVDATVAFFSDTWLAVPPIFGAIVILSFVEDRGVLEVSVVLAALTWPPMLRFMRASVLERRQEQYVTAALGLGAGPWRILRRHVLPNALGPVLVYGAAAVGLAISAEALLTFMGVGLQMPTTSWGLQLSGSRSRILGAPHLLLPGLFLVLLVAAFMLMAEALRDVVDPRTR